MSKRPQASLSAETWSHTIDTALRAAGQRILWRRALRMAALSLPFLVVAIAAYIAVLRFTLADLPAWPVILVFVPWLLFIWLWTRAQRVTSAEAARFLDHTLELDERVSTCVEVINSTRLVRSHASRTRVHYALLIDAAETLDERLYDLPGRFSLRWTRRNMAAVAVALVALLSAIAFPTYVELARVERGELAKAMQDQLAQVKALRSEIEANQHISTQLKASILSELDVLENKLQSSSLDQAAGIATLADAEQQLRALLHTPSADFDGLVAAAQLVWTSAAQNSEWDPEQAVFTTDLGRASEASLFLSNILEGMGTDEERRVSFSLERASNQASGRDPSLSKLLADASTGMRTRDHAPASRALVEAAQKFSEANGQREDSVALENVLAQLNKGREQIAQAGRPQAKKAQVGFRRRGPSADSTPTPNLEDLNTDANTGQSGKSGGQSISNTSGMGPVVGQNNVAAYTGSQSSDGSGGQPAKVDGQGDSASPGSGPGGGQNGQDGGQSGGSQQRAGGGTAGGGASDSGEQGTLGGSINGPVGGVGGAISHVPNPAGRGNATDDSGSTPGGLGDTTSGDGEQVYVPDANGGEEPGGTSGEQGNAGDASNDDVDTEGAGARVGAGESGESEVSSSTGQGGAVRVQTPYREVIGEYARQATEAIERAYVPPDAKEYVKEYFSELGK
ncbi:MAG TPA: hypothetical protein VGE04_14155 [Chloroflexia bacterium]